jgi:hypothetical protein
MSRSSYRRHRFPAAVIRQAVWLYFRFPLSLRDIKDMLSQRGIRLGLDLGQLPFSRALQVLGHLARQRQMPGIEALNLIDAGAGVFSQVEDVHLTVAQNNSHANRSMAKAVDTAIAVGHGVMFQARAV